jgi:hypothetical protein
MSLRPNRLSRLCLITTWVVTILATGVVHAKSDLIVTTDFPGGSAKVEGIDQTNRVVRLTPFPHPDRGWACWWYFKLTGVQPGETVTVEVSGMNFALPDQAMFSSDNQHWTHTAKGQRDKQGVRFQQRLDTATVWFAWGPPFQLAEANRLVQQAAKASPYATAFELCKSKEGRSVPALRISQPGAPDSQRLGIWFSARQHAWESGSSWVCRGLTEWLISDDPRAATLRQKSLITIVPIMDVDNVERGAGGKNGKPQDHNRDWSDAPHWPEVGAAIKLISALEAAGRFDLFMDLHNPAPNDRTLAYFVPPKEIMKPRQLENLERFLADAKLEMTGPLKPQRIVYTGLNYDPNWERISGNWIVRHTGEQAIAACLETAWNTPHSTQDGYRRVGRELGLSVERYFQLPNRPAKP